MPSTPFHTGVSLRGFHFEDSHLTVKLKTGIVVADIGKGLAIDPSAANTLKLAGDGDHIIARLETVEDRSIEGTLIGTASFRFSNLLPIKTGLTGSEAVVVGSTVVGAGSGEVKALDDGDSTPTPNYSINFVAEIIGTNAVVVKI